MVFFKTFFPHFLKSSSQQNWEEGPEIFHTPSTTMNAWSPPLLISLTRMAHSLWSWEPHKVFVSIKKGNEYRMLRTVLNV